MTAQERVIVVGTDFSEASDEAIIEGLEQLAMGGATTVHFMHVLDPRDVIDDPEQRALETEEQVLARAPELLRKRVLRLAEREQIEIDATELRTHARIGKAAETLMQTCVDYDADLLVVGTHGRRGMERLLLGSVAERLIRNARCPVLVARAKDYEGLDKTVLPDPPYAPGEAPRAGHDAPIFDDDTHVTSTERRDSWHPSDNGPTGFRIV